MKAEITRAILGHAIPAEVGGCEVLCFTESSIGHLVKDIQKLIKKESEPELDDNVERNIDIIIEYLNIIWCTSYKSSTEANRRYIRARMNDGHTPTEIKLVIDTLQEQWGKTDMAQYLRPITVFAPSKFEGYLNQALRLKSNEDNMIYVADSFGHKRRITKTQFEAAEEGHFTRLD